MFAIEQKGMTPKFWSEIVRSHTELITDLMMSQANLEKWLRQPGSNGLRQSP